MADRLARQPFDGHHQLINRILLIDIMHKYKNLIIVFLLLLIGGLIAATAYRTYSNYSVPKQGEFDWENRGLSDFHNGSYFAPMAFRDGVSPYSSEVVEKYPMAREAPTFSPSVFILHLPFTFFALHTADVLFFAYNTFLLALLAWLSIKMSRQKFQWIPVLSIFGLLLVSRPGHITLFTGYFTLELVIGCLLAFHYAKSKPVVSGLGMLLASAKPTYVLPLIFLMLCRRNFKAVALGILFCTIAGLAGLGWLASHTSVAELIDGIRNSQEAFHADESELPVNTWTRVDLVGMVAKVAKWAPENKFYLASMFVLMLIPGWAMFKHSKHETNSGASGLTAFIGLVTILITIYHHSYDCLLVVVPWVAVTFYAQTNLVELGKRSRWAIAFLAAVPAGNYLSTHSAMNVLKLDPQGTVWLLITLINGVCLFLVLVILISAAFCWKPKADQVDLNDAR